MEEQPKKMKIIQAMKKIKANKEKITDLQGKIYQNSSHLKHETPPYETTEKTQKMIDGWLQTCTDLTCDNVDLLCRIQKTNLATIVPITIDKIEVKKSIAEWIWRRREYAKIDQKTWASLTTRNLQEGKIQPSIPGAPPTEISIHRYFDQEKKDKMVAMYNEELHLINSELEVINAVTDLLD